MGWVLSTLFKEFGASPILLEDGMSILSFKVGSLQVDGPVWLGLLKIVGSRGPFDNGNPRRRSPPHEVEVV